MQTAAYTGTFDPITNGHSDVIRRAAVHFDQMIVAIAENPGKNPVFNLQERLELARIVFADDANIKVVGYRGLTVKLMEELGVDVMVRGLRTVTDFEYEFHIAAMNRELVQNIETMFMIPAPQYGSVSSTHVREIARHGGDVSQFAHPAVSEALRAKFGNGPEQGIVE